LTACEWTSSNVKGFGMATPLGESCCTDCLELCPPSWLTETETELAADSMENGWGINEGPN